MLSRWSGLVVVLLVSELMCGCAAGDRLERFEYTRLCMGVEARIVVYATDAKLAEENARAAFDRMAQLDAIMSDYRIDSEVTRLAQHAGGEAIPISNDLIEALSLANQIAHQSDGAFDVTVGPAVELWRAARREGRLPDDEEVANAQSLIDWRQIEIDRAAATARLRSAGMKLDLGGIAKGYAAQRAVDVLRSRGSERCFVALAGDIAIGDPPPGESGWRVAIGRGTLTRANVAVSTSGDAEQFIEVEGVRHSHIIDPRTGRALTISWEVTVIAARGELADALASACCVLGPVEGQALVRLYPGAEAIFH